MTKVCKKLILILGFMLLSQSAFCYTLTSLEQQKIIETKLQKETKAELQKYFKTAPFDFKISISGIPYSDIITDENTFPIIEIQGQNSSFQKNSAKRIIIKNSKNSVVKIYPINVQTQVFANVLCAKNIINYNDEITQNNSQFERKEVSNYLNRIILAEVQNSVSKRNYQKGSVLLADSIKEKSAVLKDSLVDIVFLSNNGLKIKLQGKALKEGSIGDTISVRSNKYNKIYNAKITSSSEVTVRI